MRLTTPPDRSARSSRLRRPLVGLLLLVLTAAPVLARPAPDSFADLAARLLPSVVNISSTETVTDDSQDDDDDAPGDAVPDHGGKDPGVQTPSPSIPPGSPFDKFFHDFMNKHGGPGGTPGGSPAAPGHKMQSLGSGFVIDPSGLIVTNNHVIKGADTITVTLQDNTVLKARLLGHDDKTDLALLKVEPAHPLPAVAFGDSDHARVGDWVLAIGNPFGLSGTVTAGIVSSRGRSLDSGPYDDFIQTDAPINRGNSGGPLFDMDGAVIGINTAIYSPSGGSIGIGFSIPSNEAAGVIAQLRQYRQGAARLDRGAHPGREPGHRRQPGAQDREGRAGRRHRAERPRREGRAEDRRRDPDGRRPGGGRPQPAARGGRDRGRAGRAARRLARRGSADPAGGGAGRSPRTPPGPRRPRWRRGRPGRRRSTWPGSA